MTYRILKVELVTNRVQVHEPTSSSHKIIAMKSQKEASFKL